MEFGKVENPELVDFTLPQDHPETKRVLKAGKKKLEVYVGCAKFNKKDLKNFYPKSIKAKEELTYYSSQFNSIEYNATFRTFVTKLPLEEWRDKTVPGFKFFPKMSNRVTHYRLLLNSKEITEEFCERIKAFEDKLGITFLQMKESFKSKNLERVDAFLKSWPKDVQLAFEVRNEDWFNNEVSEEYFKILENYKVTNVIVDTAARRDILHMRLTTPIAFVRWVGTGHATDKKRLDDWILRAKEWKSMGLEQLCFFVHQNVEEESPKLAAYFIEQINKELEFEIKVPSIFD
ncbi:MAG: DUF72 domain-containing protein [Bacteroidota bacterium]|nr:DUF72 domain-containing protein [Bacteroidota bacterium]